MAALLLIPFFLLRFGLPALPDRRALPRAAHFPPRRGGGEGAVYALILREERWCLARFGDAYARYMARVRRYL